MIVIDNGRSLLGLSRADALRALGDTAHEVSGDEYGKMKDVISLEASAVFPGTLYLKNDTVAFIRVGPDALTTITAGMLRTRFGLPAARLASRAGKQAQLWVYAADGLAFSVQGETVHFLELFTPCSQQEYEAQIYKHRGHFIR